MAISVEKKVTLGNLLTVASLVLTCIGMIFTYKGTIDSHTEKIKLIEENQKALEGRITLIEHAIDEEQTKSDRIGEQLSRTTTYLELLLEKNHISYVK